MVCAQTARNVNGFDSVTTMTMYLYNTVFGYSHYIRLSSQSLACLIHVQLLFTEYTLINNNPLTL